MKYLKITGIFLLVLAAVTTVTSMALPNKQRVERATTINAPASVVYQQLIKLENFNRWLVWNQQDSTIKNSITGTDGTVGATSSWTGDPEISGEGKMVIVSLQPNKKVVHHIIFIKPKKGEAESAFTLEEIDGTTKLTWEFDFDTPRPWNIFNLLYSMDKKMGKDFEEGLANLKMAIEKSNKAAASGTYDVRTMNFPATSFASVRQQVKWDDTPLFFTQCLLFIRREIEKVKATAGMPNGLFYSWNEKNKQADIAAAIQVPSQTTLTNDSIQVVNIPASKAVYVDYYGAYDKMNDAYNPIKKYLTVNNLKQKIPVIEQYITGPATEADTAKWLTKIIFLVE